MVLEGSSTTAYASSSSVIVGESSSTSLGRGGPDSIRQPVQAGSSSRGRSATEASRSMTPSTWLPENSIGPRRSNWSSQPAAATRPAAPLVAVASATASRARRSSNTIRPDRRIARGVRRSLRSLPRTSMPRSVARAGRGGGAAVAESSASDSPR
ncbi:MAG: hypothetical protein ACKOTB_13745, partial [Planctomycetia bacterium]